MSEILKIELSHYEQPTIIENTDDDWVLFGDKDGYYTTVIDAYTYSPTNSAIINSLSDLIYGRGLTAVSDSRNTGGLASLKVIIPDEDIRKMCKDLAMFSAFAYQVIWSKDGKRISKVKHTSYNTVRAEKVDKEGVIRNFYLCYDWSDTEKYKPKKIPNYDASEKKQADVELVVVRPYSPGNFYYNPVAYQSALPYATLEKEIAEYYLNLVTNGFMPTTMINHHNGVPDRDKRQEVKRELENKLLGKNGSTLMVTFSDSKEKAPEIITIPITDASDQYESLTEQAKQHIITGHRITSPMLLGIKGNTGLGNNADEIKNAFQVLDNTKIKPMQDFMINSFKKILAVNGVALDLFFKTVTPIEFTDTEKITTVEDTEKETGLEMSAHVKISDERLDGIADDLILVGEDEDGILEDFELFDVAWSDEDTDTDVERILNEKVSLSAEQPSAQDGKIFKVRYMYKSTTTGSVKVDRHRPLCDKLVNSGLLYRKEDIKAMSSKGGAEDKGQDYDVFLYKGGVNCQHGWERRIYRKRLTKEGKPWGGGAMNGVKRSDLYAAIRGDAKINQNQDKKAFKAPRDTPNKGHK